ncbi:hypothetical protein DUT91_16290 [Phyllobacterium salinisoli]|uniref:DUF2147 domain-containing protein n=1 Tax=Phyllobacterium salinisoli TaxID=1899321 RepID=A0A368K1I1_9HYPH|nr:hypothetical protein [Phyllobacterium salinisoli]RCS23024.1 hypothetical protein DUT91_16290 [Phyllobacterium salinisoli]
MISSLKTPLAVLVIAVLLAPFPAQAEEWTRDTRNGGQITRTITKDGNVYSGKTTRVGPDGGTYTSNSACQAGVVDRCRRSYSASGPNGRTISGNTATARGPYRVRSMGVHTGPRGHVGVGFRRRWR